METTTPNSVKELLERNSTPPTTEEVMELFVKLSYEDKDNFVYHLLQFMRNFYTSCGRKELESENPNSSFVEKCFRNRITLENLITLYEQV